MVKPKETVTIKKSTIHFAASYLVTALVGMMIQTFTGGLLSPISGTIIILATVTLAASLYVKVTEQ